MCRLWIILPMIAITWACGTDEAMDPQAAGEVIVERGPQGPKGERGEDGTSGTNGLDGEDGETAVNEVETPTGNIWTDYVTGRKWTIGPLIHANGATCDGGFLVPDINDFNDARYNGLPGYLDSIGASTLMWLQNVSDGVVESYRDLHDGSNTNSLVGGSLFCVEI